MTINKKLFDKLKGRRIYQFYLDEETGEQCPYATEYGYCRITACINHYAEKRKED